MVIFQEREFRGSEIFDKKKTSFRNMRGDVFSIQLDGDLDISVYGRHNESSEHYPLALVNMATLKKNTESSGPGLYMAIITGCDDAYIDVVSGTNGFLHIKEMGD